MSVITTVPEPATGWVRVEDIRDLVDEAYADGYHLGYEEGRRP